MASQQLDEEEIFHVAKSIPEAECRSKYLDQICAGDMALRERVEALLTVHEQELNFLKSAEAAVPATVEQRPITEAPGQEIGRYKLLQKIGEGGFGVVFMAEQLRPVRRKVALKVIKPGMDSGAVVARFEAERQALAMMEHPNIARVIDGGATDEGRPYFVMELVRGVPITEYCDKNKLPTKARLKLFVTVCQAIQHAHQKGIIHRDLKPANILVTLHDGQPVVKIIDFGVAKAINQQLTEKTLFTAFGQMVGTPQYMSPEQAEMSGLDVDTRSDVYSLGVVLYELLTGSTPLEAARLRTAGYAEMQRLIKDEEPPRPSNRISSSGEKLTIIAQHRSVSPDRLQKLVSGDLDWIVMKALEKDRSRRYESASRLSEDVTNYLEQRIVEARPPSAAYQLRKVWIRNRGLVNSVAIVLISLAIGLGMAIYGLTNSRRQFHEAQLARNKLQTTLDRLTNSLLREAILAALGGDEQRLDETRQALEESGIPDGDSHLLQAISYMASGNLERAREESEEAIRAQSSIMGSNNAGAYAIRHVALFWRGDLGTMDASALELQSLEPQKDIDRLLLAYAVMGHDPYRAQELLESIETPIARTALGLLVTGQCGSMIACDTRDVEAFNNAANQLADARLLLGQSDLAGYWQLAAYAGALEVTDDPQKQSALIAQGMSLAEELQPGQTNSSYEWWIYQAAGESELATSACRDRQSGAAFHIAADCLMAVEDKDPLARFDELTESQAVDAAGRIARAHLHAAKPGAKSQILEEIRPLLSKKSAVLRRHAIAVLCLVCDESEIESLAGECHSPEMLELEDLWHGEQMVRFYTGEIGEEDLLEDADGHGFTLGNAYFTIATKWLARGERQKSLESFKLAVSRGGPLTFDYALSKAYVKRLTSDPQWLSRS